MKAIGVTIEEVTPKSVEAAKRQLADPIIENGWADKPRSFRVVRALNVHTGKLILRVDAHIQGV